MRKQVFNGAPNFWEAEWYRVSTALVSDVRREFLFNADIRWIDGRI